MSGVAALLRGCPRFTNEIAVLLWRFVIGIMPGTIVLSPRYALGARLPLRIWRAKRRGSRHCRPYINLIFRW